MTDFWLISVPLDRTSSQSLEKLKHSVAKTKLASSFKFSIPELKVGTLDILLGVSDDLSKLDTQAERVMQRTAQCMAEVMEQASDKVVENALANGVDLVSYVTKFQWDRAKYSTALPFKSLADIIAKTNRRYNVTSRKEEKVYEEGEEAIFTVTLFKKDRFTIREFCFDQVELQKREMSRLLVDKKEQYGTFVRWLKVNFSEVFVAWIHLKVLEVFVESVLRYGLPVSFQALLLQPDKKRTKKLREQLSSLFGHLDPTASAMISSKPEVALDVPGLSAVSPQDYYSYICVQISVTLLDPS
ncbi:hypothetical protein J4Q44_G00251350 [Coregonus suidteri]|uniref:V-type proton ATPase subunit C n=1 Tax=Coregonus suidteri TaxID=861788 RepID=A0AAN8QG60_9TELE